MHHEEERLWEVKLWSPKRKCLHFHFIKFSQINYVMKCTLIASTFALVNGDRFPSSLTKLYRLSKLWAVIQLCYDSWGCYSLGRKDSEFPQSAFETTLTMYFILSSASFADYQIFFLYFRRFRFASFHLFARCCFDLQHVLSDVDMLQDRIHKNRSPKEFSLQTKCMLLTSSRNLLVLWT